MPPFLFMLTSAQFYAAADRAGMLQEAVWRPSTGEQQKTAKVDLRNPDASLLGDMVLSTDYSMTYPDTDLIGLDHDEIVTINGVTYKVRGEPRRIQDGSVMRATLGKIS